jgi:hypothetical protein
MDAGEMKSEVFKIMKNKEANDCGEASPKIILSDDEELKTSAGNHERRKVQKRAEQRKRKIDKNQEEIDIIKRKKQQQSQLAQNFSQRMNPQNHKPDFEKNTDGEIFSKSCRISKSCT